MTHDELLTKINDWEYSDYKAYGSIPEWPYKALRAVLELHKQIDDNSCHYCAHWYPCETIQAIEKELT